MKNKNPLVLLLLPFTNFPFLRTSTRHSVSQGGWLSHSIAMKGGSCYWKTTPAQTSGVFSEPSEDSDMWLLTHRLNITHGSKWTYITNSSLLWEGISDPIPSPPSRSVNSFITISTAFLSWAGRWQVNDDMISPGYLVSQPHPGTEPRGSALLTLGHLFNKVTEQLFTLGRALKAPDQFQSMWQEHAIRRKRNEKGQQVENMFT